MALYGFNWCINDQSIYLQLSGIAVLYCLLRGITDESDKPSEYNGGPVATTSEDM